MKTKRVWVFIIIFAVLAAAVLAVPIPKAAPDDGGTREYAAMTYRIVKWKKFYAGGTYEKTKVYFGKDLKNVLLVTVKVIVPDAACFGQRKQRALNMFLMRKLRRLTEALLRFVPLRARRKPQAAIKFNSTQAILNGSDLMSGRLCR